jgi:hypothetical protein
MELKTKTKGATKYFDATPYFDALAVLIEPTSYKEDVPNPGYDDRDICVADLTIFDNVAALEGTAEPTLIEGAIITSRGLVSDLKGEVGNALVFGLKLMPPKVKGHKAFPVWIELDEVIVEKVAAYCDQRDAAIAEAADDDWPDL